MPSARGSAVPALPLALALALAAPSLVAQQAPPPEDAPGPSEDAPPTAAPPEPRGDGQAAPVVRIPPMIGGGIWLAQGPAPAIGGQVEGIAAGPKEVSGALHVVAAHPANADVLYVGGVNGGVWKTTNATAASPNWVPLTDFEPSLSMGALEFDPTDATHMTLVAGIGRYSSYATRGGLRTGMLKTTDGGATWSPITGGMASPLAGVNFSGVAPRGMTLVATSNFAVPFTCAPGGLVGIHRSVDGGATFTRLAPPAGPDGAAFDLASDPASSSTLYTGLTFVPACTFGALTNGIYKSTDTGATWSKVSSAAMDALIVDGITNNIEIAADGPNVFASIVQAGRPAGIFHSGDGGATWAAMDLPRTPEGAPLPIGTVTPGSPVSIDTTPTAHGFAGLAEEVELAGVVGPAINGVWTTSVTGAFTFDLVGSFDFTAWTPGTGSWQKVVGTSPKRKPGGQGGLHASIRVDPGTGTTVYLGGDRQDSPFPNFVGATDFSGRLFRGDASVAPTGAIPSPQWEHLTHSDAVAAVPGGGTAGGSAPHADSREMVFDDAGDLIEVDDGGVYRRTSPASNTGDWFSINGNIQVTEQHDVAYDSLSDILISGNQDTGTTEQLFPGSLVWDSVSTADGGDVTVDNASFAAKSIRYSSFQNLGVFRAREYDASNSFLVQSFPALTDGGLIGGLYAFPPPFVTPVELNVADPLRLVFGGCNAIFESTDYGAMVAEIPGLTDADCSPPVTASSQNAIAAGGFSGATPNFDVLYVGSFAALYSRTGPGAIGVVGAYPGTAVIRDVVLDSDDWTDVYVVESTLTDGPAPFFSKVWFSPDSGATWHDITGNITDPGLQTAAFIPGAPERLVVGGREGVFELILPAPVPGGPFVWGELGTGLPNAPVWDLEYDATDGVLVAGTLGRGAWTLQENGTCGKPDELVVRNQWVGGAQLDEACTQITGGPRLDVLAAGDLEFVSPKVVLINDFQVKTGGKFTVDNSVP